MMVWLRSNIRPRQLGDDVNLDDCSVVAHINSRGKFALNHLKVGNGYVIFASSIGLGDEDLPLDVPCVPAPAYSLELRWRTAAYYVNIPSLPLAKLPSLVSCISAGQLSRWNGGGLTALIAAKLFLRCKARIREW